MSNANAEHRTVAVYETIIYPSGMERRVAVDMRSDAIGKEIEIEEWLLEEKHFKALELDAALIGNQIALEENNKKIDILAVTRKGRLCVVELKRDRPGRSVFIQILDYARILSGFLIKRLDAICAEANSSFRSLSGVYGQYFNAELPEKRDRNPVLVILAKEFSPPEIEMALFLNQEHKFCIRLISYESTLDGTALTMKFRDEVLPTDRLRVTSPMPAQVFELRFNETSKSLWEKCRTSSAIPVNEDIAGRIQEYEKDGPVSLLVYVDKHGYVASGSVKGIVTDRGNGEEIGSQLKMDWDMAVELWNAVFRDSTDQPTEELQELIDADKWSIVVGLMRWNTERIRRRQAHGGVRRPFNRAKKKVERREEE